MHKPAFYRHALCEGGYKVIHLGRMKLKHSKVWVYVAIIQSRYKSGEWLITYHSVHPRKMYLPWVPTEDQIDLVVEGLTAAVEQETDPSMGIKYITWLGKLKCRK